MAPNSSMKKMRADGHRDRVQEVEADGTVAEDLRVADGIEVPASGGCSGVLKIALAP